MKYAVCYNNKLPASVDTMQRVCSFLTERNEIFAPCDIEELSSEVEFAFVIGGDGTILKAARFYCEYGIPVFGINLGRLGFLSQTSADCLEDAINDVINDKYRIEDRIMLKSENYTALNDFVVKGNLSGRTVKFSLEIDGKEVCEYLADGIIVSTPTGSTAYSMSAGGAVISPDVDVIEIVPICPHTFSARPLVIDADSVIKVKLLKGCEYNVSADGQVIFNKSDELVVTKYDKKARLALLSGNDFYSVLTDKLQWAVSPAKC